VSYVAIEIAATGVTPTLPPVLERASVSMLGWTLP
jgi:hypothetical protein